MWVTPSFLQSAEATSMCRTAVSYTSHNSLWCHLWNMLIPFISLPPYPFSNPLNIILSPNILVSYMVKPCLPHYSSQCSLITFCHHLFCLEGTWPCFHCISQYEPNDTSVDSHFGFCHIHYSILFKDMDITFPLFIWSLIYVCTVPLLVTSDPKQWKFTTYLIMVFWAYNLQCNSSLLIFTDLNVTLFILVYKMKYSICCNGMFHELKMCRMFRVLIIFTVKR